MNHLSPSTEKIDDSILRKYDILHKLGSGSYGIVWKAVNKDTREIVALKKCFDAFENAMDAQQAFREIMFLHELNHENIIRLFDVFKTDNELDVYFTCECMESNLLSVIQAKTLREAQKPHVIYQVLKALRYMHSGEVLHRDVKPENILVNSDCQVKICDFGTARSVALQGDEAEIPVFESYVTSRWYRAPEILFGSTSYGKGVDLWSVGTVLAEMLSTRPLFAGSSTLDQLNRILEVTGYPSPEDIKDINSPSTAAILESLPRNRKRSPIRMMPGTTVKAIDSMHKCLITMSRKRALSDRIPGASVKAIDLVHMCLQLNSSKRIQAKDALAHAYVAQFHSPVTEGESCHTIKLPIRDDIRAKVEEYRLVLHNMILVQKGG